jgi:hypothetical protein
MRMHVPRRNTCRHALAIITNNCTLARTRCSIRDHEGAQLRGSQLPGRQSRGTGRRNLRGGRSTLRRQRLLRLMLHNRADGRQRRRRSRRRRRRPCRAARAAATAATARHCHGGAETASEMLLAFNAHAATATAADRALGAPLHTGVGPDKRLVPRATELLPAAQTTNRRACKVNNTRTDHRRQPHGSTATTQNHIRALPHDARHIAGREHGRIAWRTGHCWCEPAGWQTTPCHRTATCWTCRCQCSACADRRPWTRRQCARRRSAAATPRSPAPDSRASPPSERRRGRRRCAPAVNTTQAGTQRTQ